MSEPRTAIKRTRDRVAQIFYQRCCYLFVALITVIGATPVLIELTHGRLVAAVAAVSRSLPAFMLTTLLAGIAVWFVLFGTSPGELVIGWYAATATYLMTLAALLRYVLLPEVMTTDRLYGAAAAYMLLGVTYAWVYQIIQHHYPGAFALGGQVTELSRIDFLYFSFTVMSSTGFGDFVAVLPVSRMLVVTQQIAGVLFVAMLIARLAGIYPPRRQ